MCCIQAAGKCTQYDGSALGDPAKLLKRRVWVSCGLILLLPVAEEGLNELGDSNSRPRPQDDRFNFICCCLPLSALWTKDISSLHRRLLSSAYLNFWAVCELCYHSSLSCAVRIEIDSVFHFFGIAFGEH